MSSHSTKPTVTLLQCRGRKGNNRTNINDDVHVSLLQTLVRFQRQHVLDYNEAAARPKHAAAPLVQPADLNKDERVSGGSSAQAQAHEGLGDLLQYLRGIDGSLHYGEVVSVQDGVHVWNLPPETRTCAFSGGPERIGTTCGPTYFNRASYSFLPNFSFTV